LISCPKCGHNNSEDISTCEKCGTKLSPDGENSQKVGLKELWNKQNKKSKTYIALGGIILLVLLLASAAAVVYDNYLTKNTPVDTRYTNTSNSTSPLQEMVIPIIGWYENLVIVPISYGQLS
jgi:uncharacterized membrane protein YvbJ